MCMWDMTLYRFVWLVKSFTELIIGSTRHSDFRLEVLTFIASFVKFTIGSAIDSNWRPFGNSESYEDNFVIDLLAFTVNFAVLTTA